MLASAFLIRILKKVGIKPHSPKSQEHLYAQMTARILFQGAGLSFHIKHMEQIYPSSKIRKKKQVSQRLLHSRWVLMKDSIYQGNRSSANRRHGQLLSEGQIMGK